MMGIPNAHRNVNNSCAMYTYSQDQNKYIPSDLLQS